jgi:PadR family transcriptional regulator PadR
MTAIINRNSDLNDSRDEIPPGTLYLLILQSLAVRGKLHGYEIADNIQRTTDDVLQVEEGSLYPALQRMLLKGWVIAEWGVTAGNRRARYYSLTPGGKKQLGIEVSQFQRVMGAITRVIQTV